MTKSWKSKVTVIILNVVSQSFHCVWLFATPWTTACQASLSFTISLSLLKLMSSESMMPSNNLILCRSFSSCPPSFPASESFPVSRLFASGDQSTRALASVLPMNIQGGFPLGLTGLISLQFKRLLRIFFSTTVQKHQFFCPSLWSLWSKCHICTWLLEKPSFLNHLTVQTFVLKVMSLLFIRCLGWS